MRTTPREEILELSKLERRLYRGFLAEPYDGIGQYVLVNLSLGSTSAAVRTRLASGDFGGGRVFPIGTPVVVYSNHGKLETFLGNQPREICCIFDDFNRTDPSSWDYVWSIYSTSGATVSVDGNYGKIDCPGSGFTSAARYADNEAWRGKTVTMIMDFMISTTPSNQALLQLSYSRGVVPVSNPIYAESFIQIYPASGGGELRAYLSLNSGIVNDTYYYPSAGFWTTGVLYRVKWETSKDTSRFKVWKLTDTEPDWQVSRELTADDSFRTDPLTKFFVTGRSGFNAAEVFSIDYITFCSEQPCPTNIPEPVSLPGSIIQYATQSNALGSCCPVVWPSLPGDGDQMMGFFANRGGGALDPYIAPKGWGSNDCLPNYIPGHDWTFLSQVPTRSDGSYCVGAAWRTSTANEPQIANWQGGARPRGHHVELAGLALTGPTAHVESTVTDLTSPTVHSTGPGFILGIFGYSSGHGAPGDFGGDPTTDMDGVAPTVTLTKGFGDPSFAPYSIMVYRRVEVAGDFSLQLTANRSLEGDRGGWIVVYWPDA